MIRVLNKQQSDARVKWLRAHGYKVQRAKLCDGSTVVLKSKRAKFGRLETKVCHHCKKKKRRKRAKPKRFRYW